MGNLSEFNRMLKSTNLGGIIEECVGIFEGEKLHIHAIDMSAVVFVYCSGEVPFQMDDGLIGFGDMESMIKFFDAMKGHGEDSFDGKVDPDNLRMNFNVKDHGSFKVLLKDPEYIPTKRMNSVEEILKAKDNFESKSKLKVTLTKEVRQDLLMYISLTKSSGVVFSSKSGIIRVSEGSSNGHQFNLPVGKGSGGKETFKVRVMSDVLSSVINAVDLCDEDPVCSIGSGSPIIISSGSYFWAISPAGEE
jgi:hypothetical protein